MPERYSEIDEGQITSSATSEWELEIKDLLRQVEEVFGGKYYEIDAQTGNVVEHIDTSLALMNTTGLRYLKARMLLLANKWTALSVVNEADVKKFTLFFSDAIRMELRAKKDDFGVKKHNFESLVLAVSEFVFIALNKSIDQGERKYRRGIERRISQFAEGSKRSLMGAVSGIFSRKGEHQ